jgi:flagellar biosynthetic protein FlhB
MASDKTEQATQHRRDEARKNGDVLHSRELTAATGTLAGVMVLGAIGSHFLISWRAAFAAFLDLGGPAHWEPSEIQPTLYAMRRLALSVLEPAGVMMAAVAATALGVGIAQTG